MHSACSWRCGLLRQATNAWRQGMAELARGNAQLAESMQRQALSIMFGLGGFPVVRARIHNNLGVIFSCSGRDREAQREFAQALHLVRGRVDPATRFHQILTNNHRTAQHKAEQHPRPAHMAPAA